MLRLTEKRKALGITIPQLSKISGINVATIREAELRGDCKLSIAQKLADALDLPVEALWDSVDEYNDHIMVYEKNDDGLVTDPLKAQKKNLANAREVVTVYQVLNYRGVDSMFSFEPLKSHDSKVISGLYYLPKGYSAIYDRGNCQAVRTPTGEIIKFFVPRSKSPALIVSGGNMVFLEPLEE